jgi:sulfate/thiosulfate transport system ATP-binding protein
VRAELRAWLRRLHDEVHVTTVLVTHDQEEAMDVADRIAVLHEGRLRQVGAPRVLYDRPASDFVMSFLGPVTRIGGRPVRPHDVALSPQPSHDALEATVRRVVVLGFEVRAELLTTSGEHVVVQLTRAEADDLALDRGDVVWIRAIVERASAAPRAATSPGCA